MARAVKSHREFIDMCKAEGADSIRLVRTGAHFIYDVSKGGVTIRISVPTSPSDDRWILNKRTQLRRAFETGNVRKHQEFDT